MCDTSIAVPDEPAQRAAPTTPAFGASVRGDPFEFRRDLRQQKTRVPELSCGAVCVMQRLAVSVEHRLFYLNVFTSLIRSHVISFSETGGWLVGWVLTALLTQIRSYRARGRWQHL